LNVFSFRVFFSKKCNGSAVWNYHDTNISLDSVSHKFADTTSISLCASLSFRRCQLGEFHEGVNCEDMFEGLEVLEREGDTSEGGSVRPCPECLVPTFRSEGCNHMICPCGADWDWVSGRRHPRHNDEEQIQIQEQVQVTDNVETQDQVQEHVQVQEQPQQEVQMQQGTVHLGTQNMDEGERHENVRQQLMSELMELTNLRQVRQEHAWAFQRVLNELERALPRQELQQRHECAVDMDTQAVDEVEGYQMPSMHQQLLTQLIEICSIDTPDMEEEERHDLHFVRQHLMSELRELTRQDHASAFQEVLSELERTLPGQEIQQRPECVVEVDTQAVDEVEGHQMQSVRQQLVSQLIEISDSRLNQLQEHQQNCASAFLHVLGELERTVACQERQQQQLQQEFVERTTPPNVSGARCLRTRR
jgi:hypothetical protein